MATAADSSAEHAGMAGASNSERPVGPEVVAWARVAGPGTVTAGQPVRNPAVARIRGPLPLPRLALRCREHRCATWPPAKHQLLAALGFGACAWKATARSVHRSRAPGNREGQVTVGSGACGEALSVVNAGTGLPASHRLGISEPLCCAGLVNTLWRHCATGSAIRTPLAESVAR